MEVLSLTFGPFQENTYILVDDNKECAIVDPGCSNSEERAYLKSTIEQRGLKPVLLLNTHCHIDHVFGNAFVAEEWSLDLHAHKLDLPTLEMVPLSCQLYGIPGYIESPKPKVFIDEGDVIEFGSTKLDVIFVPGHAPGHVAFINHNDRVVINGDVLFRGSIGRTDLPGGNHAELERSIREKMYTLPDDYVVCCGHGPNTTIGEEKTGNAFFRV
jgi:glyoxylase-like metal-dependent hydrolase (beta-lactamase superfamily II)